MVRIRQEDYFEANLFGRGGYWSMVDPGRIPDGIVLNFDSKHQPSLSYSESNPPARGSY